MRLSIKAKQVAGVTVIVGLSVAALTGYFLTSLASISLKESRARAELLSDAIYHRARQVALTNADTRTALATDAGLRSILEASAYSAELEYAAIVDTGGFVIAHADAASVGLRLDAREDLTALLAKGPMAQTRAIYAEGGRTLELRTPLLLGATDFGTIRVGMSTLLMREPLAEALRPVITAGLIALVGAVIVAMLLAQVLLRPIHLIRTGLSRLGRGEAGVTLDLRQHDEFGELGESFNLASARMNEARSTPPLSDPSRRVDISHRLAALSRLTSGIAHEVKNPLNATMIHIELLKMSMPDAPDAALHLKVIQAQMRRLDEVVQGFLKFTRAEPLTLEPVSVADVFEAIKPVILAEAANAQVVVTFDCPEDVPPISADRGLIEQAVLNLAINACQAMTNGGRLRIAASPLPARRVAIIVDDTGAGIAPEHLEKIFDLYFTTRAGGSGIGLSLVYRTIQMHDGEIEVQSVPGRGTTFTISLGQAEP